MRQFSGHRRLLLQHQYGRKEYVRSQAVLCRRNSRSCCRACRIAGTVFRLHQHRTDEHRGFHQGLHNLRRHCRRSRIRHILGLQLQRRVCSDGDHGSDSRGPGCCCGNRHTYFHQTAASSNLKLHSNLRPARDSHRQGRIFGNGGSTDDRRMKL